MLRYSLLLTFDCAVVFFMKFSPLHHFRTTIYHSAIHHLVVNLVVNSMQFPPGDAR